MKNSIFWILCAALLLGSCGSMEQGAVNGGYFGHIIGSAIGGLTGGWRGEQVGSLAGVVGGAVAGAAIGSAVEKSHRSDLLDRKETARTINNFREAALEIRNAGVEETQRDGVLTRGEKCIVRFEIFNTSDHPIFDVRPLVSDETGNRHVKISENLLIESIEPHQGVRYSATIVADKKLKDGEIIVSVGVAQGRNEVTSQRRSFKVPTAKTPR
ncbi:MAG: glycine zipper family protein [Prevotella sp.]|nr:glycine zipper family protein [Prevotella sp.]